MKGPAELPFRLAGLRCIRLGIAVLALGAALAARAASPALPDQPSAAAILDKFRQSIWSEPVYAAFDLREMPRRGDETVWHGRFWGSRNDRGPVTRVEMDVGKGGFTHHILVQGGPEGGIWTSDGPGPGSADEAAILAPLVPGVEMAPFDILPMPYLYWLDSELVAQEKVRGRPSYIYVMTAPADFAARFPGIKTVRAYLDAQYDALVQSEVMGPGGILSKTLSLLELRKVGDRWIPKDVDVRNEATRDKTRLSLTAVAVGPVIGPSAFDPAQLGAPLSPPAPASLTPVAP